MNIILINYYTARYNLFHYSLIQNNKNTMNNQNQSIVL